MQNPLLFDESNSDPNCLPPFSAIEASHIEPALDIILRDNRAAIDQLTQQKDISWENFILPLEDLQDRLQRMWSPVGHINAVKNSDAWREAYNKCLPQLSEYSTDLGQHKGLYQAYKKLSQHADYANWPKARKSVVEHALRDFRLSGIELAEETQKKFKSINQRLSQLSSQFSDNVLDATQSFKKHISDESLLDGMPASALAMAEQTAKRDNKEGWLLTLDFPSYFAVMSYAKNRELRKEMHDAYVTRASNLGPDQGKYDNSAIMQEILALRHEKAQLLGYDNFADLSLARKMAESSDQVLEFLYDLAKRSRALAENEFEELCEFARDKDGLQQLKPWDTTYYAEYMRREKYALDQEQLKPYFPAPQVISGMFGVVNKLYGLRFEKNDKVDTWHDDVEFYEIYDDNDQLRGKFFLDLYARDKKRGGAWMDECLNSRHTKRGRQIPVAYLTCNFSPPVGDQPGLLTHMEVTTLFHEFGHGLHHMLTRVEEMDVAGINGVAWDAVELPSQFMENFCWEKSALDMMAKHYQTGAALPQTLYEKLLATKNYQSGMQMLRQLEFAIFDFRLHREYQSGQAAEKTQQLLDDVRQQIAIMQPAEYNRFQNSFSHIFGGGYAAGYFSYKWAEVLSADAFAKFEENGVFDPDTGRAFLHKVLEKGGSEDAMDLFVDFRGRKPTIDALLRHTGITSEKAA